MHQFLTIDSHARVHEPEKGADISPCSLVHRGVFVWHKQKHIVSFAVPRAMCAMVLSRLFSIGLSSSLRPTSMTAYFSRRVKQVTLELGPFYCAAHTESRHWGQSVSANFYSALVPAILGGLSSSLRRTSSCWCWCAGISPATEVVLKNLRTIFVGPMTALPFRVPELTSAMMSRRRQEQLSRPKRVATNVRLHLCACVRGKKILHWIAWRWSWPVWR